MNSRVKKLPGEQKSSQASKSSLGSKKAPLGSFRKNLRFFGMENRMKYTKNLEIRYHADVMVIGGGPAGVVAAIAAARRGKKVLLVEATGALGGLGTTVGACTLALGDLRASRSRSYGPRRACRRN